LLASKFNYLPDTPISEEEKDYANQLETLVREECEIETVNALVFDSDDEPEEINFDSAYKSHLIDSSDSSEEVDEKASSSSKDSDSTYFPSSSPAKQARKTTKKTTSLDKIQEIIDFQLKLTEHASQDRQLKIDLNLFLMSAHQTSLLKTS